MNIGITTTVPVELIFAAGRRAVDLNNIFIGDENPAALVELAERAGFPQSTCAWIKGIYGAIRQHGIREVIGVVEGDCAETGALLEILQSEGVRVIPFAFPHSRATKDLRREIDRLADSLGVTYEAAEAEKKKLDELRLLGRKIDEAAATGDGVESNLLFDSLLAMSDFFGEPEKCRELLQANLSKITKENVGAKIRLGCVGVPPILPDLWDLCENLGARVAYQEIPRQFSRIDGIELDLTESYREYTYPYDIFRRLEEIVKMVETRRLNGIIHYVQSFCHRQLHDRLLRERLRLPILTVEGDRPGNIDGRTLTRIEAFVEQLG